MSKVVLVQEGVLLTIAKRVVPRHATHKKYFLPPARSSKINVAECLGEEWQCLHFGPISLEERDRFCSEYVDLLGALNQRFSSRRWWATDLSSKNRFLSRYSHLLQEFWMILEVAQKETYDCLLVPEVPGVLLETLREALVKRGITVELVTDELAQIREMIAAIVRRAGSLLKDVLTISWKGIQARRALQDRWQQARTSAGDNAHVIKTFVYNHSFRPDGSYGDVFFGQLPEFLKKQRSCLFLAFVFGDYGPCLEKMRQCPNANIFPIEFFLTLGELVVAAWELFFYRIKLDEKVDFYGFNVQALINAELNRTRYKVQLYQYVHYQVMTRVLQNIPVSQLLLTYENNPWERMCILAARDSGKPVAIAGYQHTVVPQAAAGMFVSRRDRDITPGPDKILTVGEETRRIILQYSAVAPQKVVAAGGLRFEYLLNLPVEPRRPISRILLMLEGVADVAKLVNYCLRGLRGTKGYEVLLRTHPTLPLNAFVGNLDSEFKLGKDFRLSQETSIVDDIKWSDVVVYWGSTGALEALSVGKPLINFDMGHMLSYDPLFQCPDLKWTVTERDDFVQVLQTIDQLPAIEFERRRANAKAYLGRYFLPVTDAAMAQFLV